MIRNFTHLELKPANEADWEKELELFQVVPAIENGFSHAFSNADEAKFRETMLPKLIAESDAKNIDPASGRVPQTYYFLWDDDEIVGVFKLRHQLTDELRQCCGHVGYSIHPNLRGRGYATAGLSRLIKEARRIVREDALLLFTEATNVASQRVIVANGGVCIGDNGYTCRFELPLQRTYSHC